MAAATAICDPRDVTVTNGATSGSVSALNANWVDSGTATTNYCTTLSYWPYSYTYTNRVRLHLSEVEALRRVAKKDRAVREILRKFTDHIELVVDFD